MSQRSKVAPPQESGDARARAGNEVVAGALEATEQALGHWKGHGVAGQESVSFRGKQLFLKVDEVAELLRTSRKAVYALIERRTLPGVVRLGRRLLVRQADLLEWLAEKGASSPEGVRR